MGDTTRNFSRAEFACRCGCGFQDPHPILVVSLQQLRDLAGVCFTITGPCRCTAHNKAVAGARNSRHTPDAAGYCQAADGRLDGMPLRRQYELAMQVPAFAQGGIGAYVDEGGPRLHLDVRPTGPARWGRLYGTDADMEAVFRKDDALWKEPREPRKT